MQITFFCSPLGWNVNGWGADWAQQSVHSVLSSSGRAGRNNEKYSPLDKILSFTSCLQVLVLIAAVADRNERLTKNQPLISLGRLIVPNYYKSGSLDDPSLWERNMMVAGRGSIPSYVFLFMQVDGEEQCPRQCMLNKNTAKWREYLKLFYFFKLFLNNSITIPKLFSRQISPSRVINRKFEDSLSCSSHLH